MHSNSTSKKSTDDRLSDLSNEQPYQAPTISKLSQPSSKDIKGTLPRVLHSTKKIFKDNLFGLFMGVVSTILMTFVGVNLSNRAGRPTYAVTSHQILISEYEGLDFTLNGERIDNLGAVEIALWNDGNHFIDGERFVNDIPILIKESNGVENIKILGASIKQSSRESLEFDITNQSNEQGTYLEVKFDQDDALEPSDGMVVKLLYSAETQDDLCSCNWVVESRIKGFLEGFHEESWSEVPKVLTGR